MGKFHCFLCCVSDNYWLFSHHTGVIDAKLNVIVYVFSLINEVSSIPMPMNNFSPLISNFRQVDDPTASGICRKSSYKLRKLFVSCTNRIIYVVSRSFAIYRVQCDDFCSGVRNNWKSFSDANKIDTWQAEAKRSIRQMAALSFVEARTMIEFLISRAFGRTPKAAGKRSRCRRFDSR